MNIETKYSVRNKEELDFLEKAYKKLTKYYDIECFEGLNIEPTLTGVKVYPLGINSKISKIKKNELEVVVEGGENFCERCGTLFHEEKTDYAYHIDIKGTHYHIQLKHKWNHNYKDELKEVITNETMGRKISS